MSRNTNWIYNDYEFENRVNNLAWTISGMYDEDLDSSEKDYSSKDVSVDHFVSLFFSTYR